MQVETKFLTTNLQTKMKKIYSILCLLALMAFKTDLQAQTCAGVTAAPVLTDHVDPHDYFVVRVSLSQVYSQNVTVNGYIDAPSFHQAYSATIYAGVLTAESSVFRIIPGNQGPTTSITSVTPCPPFILSETESEQIVESTEYQNLFNRTFQLLDKIDSAVNQRGKSLDTIKQSVLEALNNNNYQQIDTVLFSNTQERQDYVNSLVAAKTAFLAANPFITDHLNDFVCQSCDTSYTARVNYLFNNFQTFTTYRMAEAEGSSSEPVCGSFWNKVKLGACVAICGATTGGLGGAFCVWGCWCTFCPRNSAVTSTICAN